MLTLTFYNRPYGDTKEVPLHNISPEAEAYFIDKEASLSAEETGTGGFILYADIGLKTEDGEPKEVIHIAHSGAVEGFDRLMSECKKMGEEK